MNSFGHMPLKDPENPTGQRILGFFIKALQSIIPKAWTKTTQEEKQHGTTDSMDQARVSA